VDSQGKERDLREFVLYAATNAQAKLGLPRWGSDAKSMLSSLVSPPPRVEMLPLTRPP
jgi:hypothetical protein